MHELLVSASKAAPVSGNAHGSYLTMRSRNGLIFGVINIIGTYQINKDMRNILREHSNLKGNFATVFQDQAYWQRAIASRPGSTVKAYLLGGLAWYVRIPKTTCSKFTPLWSFVQRFAIPFTFATTLGLAAVALRGDPSMRTLSPADISAGLPAAAAASAILGQSGAIALLVLLFLAVTSATSAELIAVSSILTYDVYKVRFTVYSLTQVDLTDCRGISTLKQIMHRSFAWVIWWSASPHLSLPEFRLILFLRRLLSSHCAWALLGWYSFTLVYRWAGSTYVIYNSIGVLMLMFIRQTFMGVILGSGVVPIALCVTWSKANKWGCIIASLIGFGAGIIAWLVTTSTLNGGVINVTVWKFL